MTTVKQTTPGNGLPQTNSAFRDPYDVALIFRLSSTIFILGLLLCASLGWNMVQYYRRPDRIVAVTDQATGAVVQILNNRDGGEAGPVKLEKDEIKKEDKEFLAEQFLTLYFTVDPTSRKKDLNRALRLMTPGVSASFVTWLTNHQVLENERAENRHATWKRTEMAFVPGEHFKLDIRGNQDITRFVEGKPVQETKPCHVVLTLAVDPAGRNERNLNSGLQVVAFENREVPASPAEPR